MVEYLEKIPTPEEYNNLRELIGWQQRESSIVKEAFKNTLYAVCAYDGDKLIGFGRIIGDKTIFVYVHDITVDPNYQNQYIGTGIMNRIINKAKEYKKESPEMRVYLGAVKGKEEYYRKFGFITRREADLGEAMILMDE